MKTALTSTLEKTGPWLRSLSQLGKGIVMEQRMEYAWTARVVSFGVRHIIRGWIPITPQGLLVKGIQWKYRHFGSGY